MKSLKETVENFIENGYTSREQMDSDVRNFMSDVSEEQGWTEDQVRAAFAEYWRKIMIDCECSITHPSEVNGMEIERVREPDSLDYSGSQQTASEIIHMLDRHYSREQVHAVAKWMLYLSTQAQETAWARHSVADPAISAERSFLATAWPRTSTT